MVLMIAFLLGCIILLLCVAAMQGGTDDVVKERVKKLQKDAPVQVVTRYLDEGLDRPLTERLFGPLMRVVTQRLEKMTPSRLRALAAQKVMLAGGFRRGGTDGFITVWAGTAVVGTAAVCFFLFGSSMGIIQKIILLLAGAAVSAVLPILAINQNIRRRQQRMRLQLPDTLDLLCVSVQAGLSLDGALSRVTDRMKGPFVDECAKMLREMRVGVTRRTALVHLAERCQIQEVSLFTAAVIQADQLGVGIAKVLTVQSSNMRERHRQYIKEAALKAPVKMVLPLAVFIFPALFIVVLAPVVLQIIHNIGKINP